MKLFILLGLLVCFSFSQSETLLQTVGLIGNEVISSRDVQICYALDQVLFGNETKVKEEDLGVQKDLKAKPSANRGAQQKNPKSSQMEIKLDPQSKEFPSETSACLLESIAQKEAQSFQVAQIDKVEIASAIEKVQKKIGTHSDWQKLQVAQEELARFVEQKLVAKRFIQIKTDSMTAIVTDQEAQLYFEKNRLKFGQLPFAQFSQNIKKFLQQQQLEDRLKTLFETLRKKYKVRNYLTEGSAPK